MPPGRFGAALANPGRWALDLTRTEHKGRFYNDRMLFRSIPFFRDYVFESGVAALAGQAMAASEIRIFFDHLFVKEPETTDDAIQKVCDVSRLTAGGPARDDQVFPVVWRRDESRHAAL